VEAAKSRARGDTQHWSVRTVKNFTSFDDAVSKLMSEFDECIAEASPLRKGITREAWPICVSNLNVVTKSMYDPQLRIWLDYFPPSAFCVISSTYFQSQQTAALTRITSFLGLPPHDWETLSLRQHSQAHKMEVDVTNGTVTALKAFFRRYGQRVYTHVEANDYWGCVDATW
jgi:hypothetical protein